jgi:hypothetical protein
MEHCMFISRPIAGRIFVAVPSPKGHKRLIWSFVPSDLRTREIRIEAKRVPKSIRRTAYRLFTAGAEGDRS